jgi:DNA-binding response OmpR family regulator
MNYQRVLIVEDEKSVARSLEFGLQKEGYQTSVAFSGEQALEQTTTFEPHMILLDLRLPDISGLDVCKTLRNKGMKQPILILTARDDEMDKVLGLELGADDYVVKPYHLRELIARIRSLLRRAYGELAKVSAGEKIEFGEIIINLETLEVQKRDQTINLTPTEFRLLRYLAQNPNRPISRDALIEMVWGYDDPVGSRRTVDVHIRHIRKKIEDDPSSPEFIQTVRGMGYKLNLKNSF